ncbi:hypothetical protein JVT61DRAFT_7477 [Boletus reticuloceps]|uniref:Protein kinase domain-containing protein n=1 Tax=Boletus reticuloceps TaxID=495285 RepID=A0A8I3A7S7_9AGAM|nr:hypothetical protein JVT61DRAFT_7477 [Boletus reticuloceps]
MRPATSSRLTFMERETVTMSSFLLNIIQPEFNLPKEEQDHQRIIEYAGSNALENKLTAASTSEYMAYLDFIYNGRPAGCMGPPITIYEEVFADIADDLAHLEDLPDTNQDILDEIGDFANQSLQTYSSTFERESTLYHLIETLLGVEMIRNEDYSTFMDMKRHAVAKERDAIYLYVECKNELGLGGMERGALTMLRYIANPKYAPIRNVTCCPCIHISIAGPYISFGGSILTDIYNFQPFTDYMFPGSYSYMASKTNHIAKVFGVFRSALNKLRDKYKGLEYYGPMRKNRSRLLPQPGYLADPNIQTLAFKTRFLPRGCYYYPICLALFLAKFGGQQVMVKFSERYSPDAHYAVAKAGLAPKLLFHTRLRGGVHMAIMEYIDGSDAKHEFSNRELTDDVVKQVKAAITILHDMNLVHGDVRRSNILIKKEQESEAATDVDPARHAYRAYLVDFDRVGLASVDRYTPFLNMVIYWPPGVRPGGLMEKEHDDVLFQRIIRSGSDM